MALAQANQTQTNGNPVFSIQNVPPVSTSGLPDITQPDVYFGLNDPGYVVADTKQPELDYQLPDGNQPSTHYQGTGGVQLSSFLTRAAFAVRLGDFNLLISNLITHQVADHVRARHPGRWPRRRRPFLSFDADPYAVVVDGHIDWILDGYTTTAEYPYSQNADTSAGPPAAAACRAATTTCATR